MMPYQEDENSDPVGYSGPATVLTGLPRTIRRHELRLIVPLADSTIYVMEKRGEFPRRFNLTPRCVVWGLEEVEAWLEQRRQTYLSKTRAVFTNPAKELVSRCSASSAAVTAFSTSSGIGRLGRSEPSSGPGSIGNGQRTARASLESCPSSSSPNGPDATLSLFRSAALPRRPMNSARS